MHIWCTLCKRFVDAKDPEKVKEHEPHSNKLVGIRHDIMVDEMDNVVWRLRTMGRLEPLGK
jgi:hypothetical protein